MLASVLGFLVGQLLNAYVLVWIERKTRAKLWARLLGSTVVGEFADTVVFCTIAFYGVITGSDFVTYVIVGFVYKTTVEIVLLPITYRIIAFVKKREPRTSWSRRLSRLPDCRLNRRSHSPEELFAVGGEISDSMATRMLSTRFR